MPIKQAEAKVSVPKRARRKAGTKVDKVGKLRKARRVGASGRAATSARLAISFDPILAAKVKKAAQARKDGNVSAWLAEAAEEHLRHAALTEVLRWMELKNGPSRKEDLERLELQWPRD